MAVGPRKARKCDITYRKQKEMQLIKCILKLQHRWNTRNNISVIMLKYTPSLGETQRSSTLYKPACTRGKESQDPNFLRNLLGFVAAWGTRSCCGATDDNLEGGYRTSSSTSSGDEDWREADACEPDSRAERRRPGVIKMDQQPHPNRGQWGGQFSLAAVQHAIIAIRLWYASIEKFTQNYKILLLGLCKQLCDLLLATWTHVELK